MFTDRCLFGRQLLVSQVAELVKHAGRQLAQCQHEHRCIRHKLRQFAALLEKIQEILIKAQIMGCKDNALAGALKRRIAGKRLKSKIAREGHAQVGQFGVLLKGGVYRLRIPRRPCVRQAARVSEKVGQFALAAEDIMASSHWSSPTAGPRDTLNRSAQARSLSSTAAIQVAPRSVERVPWHAPDCHQRSFFETVDHPGGPPPHHEQCCGSAPQ